MASISSLAPKCESNGTFVDIKMAYTGSLDDPDAYCTLDDTELDDTQRTVRSILSKTKSVKTQPKRFDLYGEIYPESTVFCQGSAGLKDAVRKVCEEVDAVVYLGRGGAREDIVS